MHARAAALAAVLTIVFAPDAARAQCPPSCPVKGGGDETTNCHSELASDTIRLNAPFFNPAKPKAAKAAPEPAEEPADEAEAEVRDEAAEPASDD